MQSRFHVAIIMDGNGRWARQRSMPRLAGHRRGADALRRTIEACPQFGITDLTLYAFSSDNWKRPAYEVNGLMELFRHYLMTEAERCAANDARLSVIGRRDRLPAGIPELIERVEADTQHCRRLHVRLAVDYSSRDELVRAARTCAERRRWSREDMSAGMSAPDVDLLIRTGGEQRLSDFLLWEAAYAEFVFVAQMWPDFSEQDLEQAVAVFRSRQRRFGSLPAA